MPSDVQCMICYSVLETEDESETGMCDLCSFEMYGVPVSEITVEKLDKDQDERT